LLVSILTRGAGTLVCVCVFGGGDIGSINFYTGCRNTNVCVSVCLCASRGGDSGSINFYTGCRTTNVCVSVCLWRW
jgi:hypothetical protein